MLAGELDDEGNVSIKETCAANDSDWLNRLSS